MKTSIGLVRSGRGRILVLLVTALLGCGMAVVPATPAAAVSDCSLDPYGCQTPKCGSDQDAGCNESLYLHNGTVQHNPRIYLIFWGSGWNSGPDSGYPAYLANEVFGKLRGTAFNNILTQYSDASGPVNNDAVLGGYDVDTSTAAPGVFLESYVNPEIDREVAKKSWPATDDTQFIVFPQPGTDQSQLTVCGRHYMRSLGASGTAAWVASSKSDCDGSESGLSGIALHEYAEAATDPQGLDASWLPTNVHGWATDDPHNDPVEVADKCEGWSYESGSTYTVTQPLLWSPAVNACTIMHGKDYPTSDPGWSYHTVYGAILDRYIALQETGSALGVPTSEEHSIGSGRVSTFAGTSCGANRYGEIYWSSGTGAYEVHGCIDSRYQAGIPDQSGGAGPTSSFGFPKSNETPVSGGSYNTFAGTSCGAGPHTGSGSAIYWNAASGTAYELHGCLYQNYAAAGGPGSLGMPRSNETKVTGGYYNLLAGTSCGSSTGSGLYWVSSLSAAFRVYGCIYQAYAGFGGPTSVLGLPTSDEYAYNGGRRSDFQCGSISYLGGVSTINVTCNGTSYYAPQVNTLESNTTACPGSSEYFTTNDYSGKPIGWTYANGSHACIQVLWQPTFTSNTCTFSVYVPNGYATGTINFLITYLVNGDIPRTRTVSLNENPVSGYQTLTTEANVASIQFGDNTGQSYPTQIGWGMQAANSLRQAC